MAAFTTAVQLLSSISHGQTNVMYYRVAIAMISVFWQNFLLRAVGTKSKPGTKSPEATLLSAHEGFDAGPGN